MTEESNVDPGEETDADQAMEREMAAAIEAEAQEQAEAQDQADAEALAQQTAAAEFGELVEGMMSDDGPAALSMLYDLSMPVAIELGRTRMSVQDILSLGRGSVIQLDRLAGEPIDVFVGDRRFAEGEVVVVGEQFGVRITRILTKRGHVSAEATA